VAVASAFAVIGRWSVRDLAVYLGLLVCGLIAIESTSTVLEVRGNIGRDLQTVWYLAIAVALPPAYALLAPFPLTAYRLWRQRRVPVYRRVFSNATISLAYGCASVVFHLTPARIGGESPGTGLHALTWAALAAACGLAAWLVNNGLLAGAVRLADPQARLRDLFGNAEGFISDAIELSLAVSVTLLVAVNPVLMVLALPPVALYRRYLMSAQLAAHGRIDGNTGLLNAGTWRREAEIEFFRALRARVPLALVMIEVDNFPGVSESVGRAAGDQVLRSIAKAVTENLRVPGLIGRVGDEEFAILLPRMHAAEARRVGERLRDHVAAQSIAVEDAKHAVFVFRLTVSIGIAVLNEGRRALAELISDADTAVAAAKNSGRNRVYVLPTPAGEGGAAAGEQPSAS
jgi:diguanylate cyclase (GGDEF)-like protein